MAIITKTKVELKENEAIVIKVNHSDEILCTSCIEMQRLKKSHHLTEVVILKKTNGEERNFYVVHKNKP